MNDSWTYTKCPCCEVALKIREGDAEIRHPFMWRCVETYKVAKSWMLP